MSSYLDNIRRVVPYVPGEQPKGNVIKLNTNENPYPPAPEVQKILEESDAAILRKYPDATIGALTAAIAEEYGVEPEQVFVGIGSDDVLGMEYLTCFAGQKPIAFPDISYSFYDVWAELFRIPYKAIPVKANDMTMFCSPYPTETPIQSIGVANPTAGPTQGEADNLYVWDAVNGYTTYFFYVGEEPDEAYDYKWYESGNEEEPTENKIAPGQAMWYVRLGTATDITFAGEVLGSDKAIPVKANGMTMFCSPYPEATSIQSLNVANPTAGLSAGESDNLYLWDATTGYTTYFYYVGEEPDEAYDYKWYESGNEEEPTTNTIAPGQAAWYVRLGNATTISFESPVK